MDAALNEVTKHQPERQEKRQSEPQAGNPQPQPYGGRPSNGQDPSEEDDVAPKARVRVQWQLPPEEDEAL